MNTPYILPAMIQNLSPFGIDWTSIPTAGASEAQNLDALWDICLTATGDIDLAVNMPLRAIAEVETLDGPNDRLTVRGSNGTALALMQHWPIIDALGGQITPSGAFPYSWQPIPGNMMAPQEPSAQFVGGSSVPSGGGDGMNGIIIAPGYVDWVNGRFGYTVQIAYVNGWPVAGLDQDADAGATTIHVDDVTGFAGCRPQIWDAGASEMVTVTAVAADSPVNILPNLPAQIGPGTLTLSQPLRNAHSGSTPATVLVSAMPDVVREAGYYFAAAEAMQRGTMQIAVPELPGAISGAGGSAVDSLQATAAKKLGKLARAY